MSNMTHQRLGSLGLGPGQAAQISKKVNHNVNKNRTCQADMSLASQMWAN